MEKKVRNLAVVLLLGMMMLTVSCPVSQMLSGSPESASRVQVIGDWNTWTGLGSDNKASTAGNWENGSLEDYDSLVWSNDSVKNCTFDIDGIYQAIIMRAGYTGNVTLDADVTSNLTVIDATSGGGVYPDNITWYSFYQLPGHTLTQRGDFWHLDGMMPNLIFNIIWAGNLTFYQTLQSYQNIQPGGAAWLSNHWTIKSGYELKFAEWGVSEGGSISGYGGGAVNITIEENAILTILPTSTAFPMTFYPGFSGYRGTPRSVYFNWTNDGIVRSPGMINPYTLTFWGHDLSSELWIKNETIELGNITCPILFNNEAMTYWIIDSNGALPLGNIRFGTGGIAFYQGSHDMNIDGNFTLASIAPFYGKIGYDLNVSYSFIGILGQSFYQGGALRVHDIVLSNHGIYNFSGSPIYVNGSWSSVSNHPTTLNFNGSSLIASGTAVSLKMKITDPLENLLIANDSSVIFLSDITILGWLNFSDGGYLNPNGWELYVNASNVSIPGWAFSNGVGVTGIWTSSAGVIEFQPSVYVYAFNLTYVNMTWLVDADSHSILALSEYNLSVDNGIVFTFNISGVSRFNCTVSGLFSNWTYNQLINAYQNKSFETDFANTTVGFSFANTSENEFSLVAQEIDSPIGDDNATVFDFIPILAIVGGLLGVAFGLYARRPELLIIGGAALFYGVLMGGFASLGVG